MRTYIVLLRGVMPVGKNKVPMAELRRILTDSGYKNVRTYIASGNVMLRSNLSPSDLARQVRNLIKQNIGPDLVVLVKTPSQLRKILDGNPIKKADMSRVFYTMFEKEPPPHKVRELTDQDYSPEEIAVRKNVAYVYIPGNYARTKLNNNSLEKKLGVSSTTRNLNTMRKLIEMSKDT